MAHVVVLATGGTIASSSGSDGASVANRGAGDLLAGLERSDITVESKDIFQLGSYLLEHRHLRLIAEAAAVELDRPDVDGVVITHGTDTMEETAYLLDLVHSSAKPVVLTGAQLPADAPDTDGPANLRAAIGVAASCSARDKGVLISFAGLIFAARGTRKFSTIAASPFRSAEGGPIGQCYGSEVRLRAAPLRPAALALPTNAFDATRVDVIDLYPGADAVLPVASVDAGASAIILAGTGTGNANHEILNWVRQAIPAGVVIGLSTRVPEGPVVPIYGNGGGVDLVRAGAIALGTLPVFQGRILLALLLSAGASISAESLDPYL